MSYAKGHLDTRKVTFTEKQVKAIKEAKAEEIKDNKVIQK